MRGDILPEHLELVLRRSREEHERLKKSLQTTGARPLTVAVCQMANHCDGETGKQIWKTFTVADPAIARKKSKSGSQLYGPAGAAVWSAPTIDVQSKLVYVATGDSYTDSDIPTSDAVMALDMATGKIAWTSQVTERDNFIMGCPASPNCPEEEGPDYDFGTSPILRSIGSGKRMLVVAQKSGIVWGLDPDQRQ